MSLSKLLFLRYLLLAVFAFQSLVPAGWMPARTEIGRWLSVVICSGGGSRTILIQDETQETDTSNPSDSSRLDHKSPFCNFSLNRLDPVVTRC
jgi:hypothetical protein